MPISVPKAFKEELTKAARAVASGVATGVGIAAGTDFYRGVTDKLKEKKIPHKVHQDESTVPADHVYVKP
jgi:hypothetical protein